MDNQLESDYASPPLDEGERFDLFSIRLEGVPASVFIQGEEIQVPFTGDLLVLGALEGETFSLHGLRHISFWSEAVEALEGPLAFAGPVEQGEFPYGAQGELSPIDLRLFYRALGQQEAACTEEDAVHPLLEVLRGGLAWETSTDGSPESLKVRLSMVLEQPVGPEPIAVNALRLGPVDLRVMPVVSADGDSNTHNSLTPCGGAAPAGGGFTQKALKVRFISISTTETPASLEGLAQTQINGACQVWWSKGGIRIVPEATAVIADAAYAGIVNTTARETNLPAQVSSETGTAVEVYLVDQLGDVANPNRGGGVTHNCGTFDAYIILEIDKARHNRFLLAHELGHVLGLTHPASVGGGCPGKPPGSECSVMVPERPCSPRNTENNLNVASMFPVGPVLSDITNVAGMVLACGRAADAEQGFFHLVRDFPADDGSQPSVPAPPASNWWKHSDVWNATQGPALLQNQDELYADGTPMFNPDYTPRHTEPLKSAVNHMLVRLQTCQSLTSTVHVHLFLAVPGASTEPLHRLTPTNPPDPSDGLEFPSAGNIAVRPGVPLTKEQTWTVPSGYPKHCCVFAVALSADQPNAALSAIVANPAAHNFYSLSSKVAQNNDVAQRNLNVHKLPSTPEDINDWRRVSLAWIGIANPFEEPAPASLIIDTRDPEMIRDIMLEIDGQAISRFEPVREPATIKLHEALKPDRFHALRLHANIRAGLRIGDQVPIDLQVMVAGDAVVGYGHVVQIAPLEQVTRQVLDDVYGALVDTHTACRSSLAGLLAEKISDLVDLSLKDPNAAIDSLVNMLPAFGTLAASIQGNGRLCSELGHFYMELTGVLATAEHSLSRTALLEQTRLLADRIQESAGRIARKMLRG